MRARLPFTKSGSYTRDTLLFAMPKRMLRSDTGRQPTMKITKLVPWLVKAAGTYWGEYFFVEVRTDAGISGWGEITTTTKIANRPLRV
jgi:hypothetical protein